MTTVVLYVVGCVLVAGGEVLFLLSSGRSGEGTRASGPGSWGAPAATDRPPGRTVGLGPGRPVTQPDGVDDVTAADRVVPAGEVGAQGYTSGEFAPDDDFALWERELRGGRCVGREHDQRSRRCVDRWERDSRRRRRGWDR